MGATSINAWLSRLSAARLRALFDEGPEHAAVWVRVLALEGVPAAQVCHGRMLLEGTGTAKNTRDALFWFKRAAAQGDMDAFNMVGRCLENGWGSDINVAAAAVHYQAAADAGHAWAQYNLGHLYLDGNGVEPDASKAYGFYLAAAAQGHARAMNLAGRCCEEGWGARRDLAMAAHWYRRSAELGYFRGQYNWASILLKCHRGEEAVLWFERAARGGTPAIREAVLQVAAAPSSLARLGVLANRLHTGLRPLGV